MPMNNIIDRIKESGKSVSRISKVSKIPEARIVEILDGAEPTLAELRKLASAIGFSLSDFALGTSTRRPVAFLFRQTMGELKTTQLPTVDLLSSQMERSLELLPFTKAPHWMKFFEGSHETYSDAERDADTFRNLFFGEDQVSPILRLPELVIEKMGVLLLIAQRQRIDGASAIIDGIPFVFVSPRFPPRMLFTLAHEVGHLVAHHQSNVDFAIFDVEKSIGTIRRKRDKRDLFADAFASCLLMPVAGVGIALKKIREIYKIQEDQVGDVEILLLGRIFGVSFQVAAWRCETLNLLPRGGAISLYDEICKQHGSPEKRAAQLQLPPRPEVKFPCVPQRLLEAAVQRIRNGEISIGRASAALNVSISSLIDANRRPILENPV
jgi:Zn-dependent peptidase ImmA (M78 family)